MNSKQLRKAMRARRRQLSARSLSSHSRLMARQANRCKALQIGKHIAFYFAADGEMDPKPLIERALKAGKKCYVPVLRERPSNALWFSRYERTTTLKPNRFGIPEPARHHRRLIAPWGLDLILLPLVAFDLTGNRLGMGGGYYDRTLSFRRKRNHWKGPALIGLAHEFQRIDSLPRYPWDIPLDGVITDQHFYRFTSFNHPFDKDPYPNPTISL
jgi:5-formyltetrahydrofolate cyclo-ligase